MVLEVYERAASSAEEVSAGVLICACGETYPIWRGVPRMRLDDAARLPAGFVQAFGERLAAAACVDGTAWDNVLDMQWPLAQDGDVAWEMDLGTRTAYFCQELRLSRDAARGVRILDAGCGDGSVSASIAALGYDVVAFDYSVSVERAEEQKKDSAGGGRVHYLQADVRHPPFARGAFDAVYAGAVIHYTPDARQAFEALAGVVKADGRMFVSLARRDLPPSARLKALFIQTMRLFVRRLPLPSMKVVCFGYALAQQALLRVQHAVGLRKHRKIVPVWVKARDSFDTFATPYYHRHVPAEVESWFRAAGFPAVVDATMPPLKPFGFGMLGFRDRAG